MWYPHRPGPVSPEQVLKSSLSLHSEIPNAVIRSKGDKMTYIGHEFDRCRDYSSLHYRLSCEKASPTLEPYYSPTKRYQGFVVDWDAQKAVWDGIFSDQVFGVCPLPFHHVTLILLLDQHHGVLPYTHRTLF